MGYLDDLKRQAEQAQARQTNDRSSLERNMLVVEAACTSAHRYFTQLATQLNVLKPVSRAVFRFDTQTEFRNLQLSGFRADARMKKLRHVDVFDHVSITFDMKTGTRLTIAKDFPPTMEKLEARLLQCGAPYTGDVIRDPATGKFVEKRYEIRADFRGSVRVLPDHDAGWVEFQVVNIEGLGTTRVKFPGFEIGTARLDELARWMTGEPNRFLDGGHELRRIEY